MPKPSLVELLPKLIGLSRLFWPSLVLFNHQAGYGNGIGQGHATTYHTLHGPRAAREVTGPKLLPR